MKKKAYIGIGSNLGDREKNIHRAIEMLNGNADIEVIKTSSLYKTEAVLPDGSPDQPSFLNGAVEIETSLEPKPLLAALMDIESELGRPSPRPKNSPRTIDLDILLFDDRVVNLADLQIPHPELEKRLFVLQPLCDIAPAVQHPVTGLRIEELLNRKVGR